MPMTEKPTIDVGRRDALLRGVAALVALVASGMAAWAGYSLDSVRRRWRVAERANAGRAFAIPATEVPGPGGALRVMAADRPLWLVRHDDGVLVAFDAACTHQDCRVLWRREAGRFQCPCHGGAFDGRTGDPVAGPPKKPLRRYLAEPSPDGAELLLRQEG